MKLININSRKGVVNLFADFILSKLDNSKFSVIQVFDFEHFFIINGKTTSTKVLDCSNIKNEFISRYQNLLNHVGITENLSIMDLIKYDCKDVVETEAIWFEYFNSKRPIFSEKIFEFEFESKNILSIDNNDFVETVLNYESTLKKVTPTLTICSEFPHGYGSSIGRNFLYYGELICFNLKDYLIYDKIKLKLSNKINDFGDTDLEIIVNEKKDDKLKSLILDIFDFDYNLIDKKLKDYDFCSDILEPFSNKPWLYKTENSKELFTL